MTNEPTQPTELRLHSTGAVRGGGRLDRPLAVDAADPSIQWLVDAASAAGAPAIGWLLDGGEPTLRADLPELLSALSAAGAPRLGLATDGLALSTKAALLPLRAAGLRRVRLPLHCARPDAHDWLVGRAGAAKAARRAFALCGELGLEIEAEITITRPTAPYLLETVRVLHALGATTLHLRRLRRTAALRRSYIALAPRFGLLEPWLDDALTEGTRLGLRLFLHDHPACAAPRGRGHRLPVGAERALFPPEPGWPEAATILGGEPLRCPGCPGDPHCEGAPPDYIEHFGAAEFRSERGREATAPAPENTPRVPPPPPPPRRGRAPATRLRALTASRIQGSDPIAERLRLVFRGPSRVACPACGDHGLSGEPPESSRAAKVRMVKASQEGALRLVISDACSSNHPDFPVLLRELTRLSHPRIEIAGELGPLDRFDDDELHRVRKIARFDAAIYGPSAARSDAHSGLPGAFDAALRVLRRLQSISQRSTKACYGLLHDGADLPLWQGAWDSGLLPGAPAMRLAAKGASLRELAAAAGLLPEGAFRDALAAILPPCLLDRDEEVTPAPSAERAHGGQGGPSGSGRFGSYAPCDQAAGCGARDRCPGLARGWDAAGIDPLSVPFGAGG